MGQAMSESGLKRFETLPKIRAGRLTGTLSRTDGPGCGEGRQTRVRVYLCKQASIVGLKYILYIRAMADTGEGTRPGSFCGECLLQDGLTGVSYRRSRAGHLPDVGYGYYGR